VSDYRILTTMGLTVNIWVLHEDYRVEE